MVRQATYVGKKVFFVKPIWSKKIIEGKFNLICKHVSKVELQLKLLKVKNYLPNQIIDSFSAKKNQQTLIGGPAKEIIYEEGPKE